MAEYIFNYFKIHLKFKNKYQVKMKKLLLSLAIVLLSASGFAQPYRSYFGNEYTKWSVLAEIIAAVYTIECASRPDATIVIDDVTYYKFAIIDMWPDTWSINVNDSYFDRYFLASKCYLREDQTTGRLYVRTSSDMEEFIVSDMSLQVGDSIRLYVYEDMPFLAFNLGTVVYNDGIPYAVVDSVYYADGLKHIHTSAMFRASGEFLNLEFIEGIGSNLTPILNYRYYSESAWWGMYNNILCYENETYWKHYPLDGDDTCFIVLTGINEIKQAEIKVYPSPAEKYIYVDFDSRNGSDIIITNILGQVVKDISFEGTRTSIDVADLKSGIYFVKSGDSVVKFVKL